MTSCRDRILEDIVRESTTGLFEDNGVPVHAAKSVCSPIFMCGVIGFSGTNARGSLMCATTFEPLQRVARGGSASERDWLGELSNQLLGRIKTRLLRRGIEIHLTPPVVLRGEHLAPVCQRECLIPYQFATEAGGVFVWLDIELDVALGDEVDTSPLAEGETVMF